MLTAEQVAELRRAGKPSRWLVASPGLYIVVGGPNAAHWERQFLKPGSAPAGKRQRRKVSNDAFREAPYRPGAG